MNNVKRKIKNFWNKNGDKIKFGMICGLAGMCYGTVKGVKTTVAALDDMAKNQKSSDLDYDDDELAEVADAIE